MENNDFAMGYAMGNDRDRGGFMDEGIWLFAILAMMGGGFGNWGNRGIGGNPVTEADLCNANSFSELKSSVGRLSDQVDNVNINLTKAVCELGYTTLNNFNTLERQVADATCNIQRGIDSVRFDAANYAAQGNATTVATGQKILDAICGLRMEMKDDRNAQLTQRVNQLEMRELMSGVVRWPNQVVYTAGFPFLGGNCCNGGFYQTNI